MNLKRKILGKRVLARDVGRAFSGGNKVAIEELGWGFHSHAVGDDLG